MELGKYRHFKGFICEVIGVGKHTETGEDMVVYNHQKKNGEKTLRVRPLKMFQEKVVVDLAKDGTGGKEIERFTYIRE